jgi:hypothetical protein
MHLRLWVILQNSRLQLFLYWYTCALSKNAIRCRNNFKQIVSLTPMELGVKGIVSRDWGQVHWI